MTTHRPYGAGLRREAHRRAGLAAAMLYGRHKAEDALRMRLWPKGTASTRVSGWLSEKGLDLLAILWCWRIESALWRKPTAFERKMSDGQWAMMCLDTHRHRNRKNGIGDQEPVDISRFLTGRTGSARARKKGRHRAATEESAFSISRLAAIAQSFISRPMTSSPRHMRIQSA